MYSMHLCTIQEIVQFLGAFTDTDICSGSCIHLEEWTGVEEWWGLVSQNKNPPSVRETYQ